MSTMLRYCSDFIGFAALISPMFILSLSNGPRLSFSDLFIFLFVVFSFQQTTYRIGAW